MRALLLALPALLSAFVIAVPSPASSFQQPLQSQTAAQTSRWRHLSDRIIGSLFGVEKTFKSTGGSNHVGFDTRSRQPPAHPLARYEGDVVLRFNISTAEEAEGLREAVDTLLLDVWDHTHDWVDIRLSKDIVPSLLGLLPATLQQSHAPLLHERDLAQAIYDTYPRPSSQPAPQTSKPPSLFSPVAPSTSANGNREEPNRMFLDYQPIDVIYPWMRFLASFFTTHTRLISIGTSYEGREILGLRIGVHPTNNEDPDPPKRKTILITGGLHAREWISTSSASFVAWSLITGYGKTQTMTTMLETFDFVVIPTVNPDGYEYSWTTDRLWRKNRQATDVRFCPGIDLDRGFGFQWDAFTTTGNPCSENFAGEAPFEAVESKQLADWAKNEIESNNVEFIGLVDLHSYSQEILYPFSYSCSTVPPGQENLEELALGLAKAIRLSSGNGYDVLAACEGNVAPIKGEKVLLPMVEEQGGSALDWFYHEMHVKYAYQIKLRDRGTYGFLLPRENIVPTGREVLEAVMYLGQFLQDNVYGDAVKGDADTDPAAAEGDALTEESLDIDVEEKSRIAGEEIEKWIEKDWVVVEDLDEPQIELRRRRKR